MVMSDESIVSYRILQDDNSEILDLHLRRLCAHVSSLDDNLLFSFVDYVTDETKFYTLIIQIMWHVTKGNISDQMKTKAGLNPNEGVTLLMELTRGSAKFNKATGMARRARLRGTSTKTFRDVAKHSEKYQFDERITYSGFCTARNHGKDLIFPEGFLVLPESPTRFCNCFALPFQIVCVDPGLSIVVHGTACQDITFV